MDREDELAEQLDRLLDGDQGLDAAAPRDPRLRLALRLRAALPPEPPSPDFRARLKADLLEQYANNVRPFPASSQEGAQGDRRHARVAASGLAVAAAIALAIGLRASHQDRPRTSNPPVARVVATSTATPRLVPALTAVPPRGSTPAVAPAPSATLAQPRASATVRAGRTPSPTRILGSGQLTENPPAPPSATPMPSATATQPALPAPPRATFTPRPTVEVAQVVTLTPKPSATPLSPSATPVPPSATLVPPSATALPSATPVPPGPTPPASATRMAPPSPTVEAPSTPSATATAVPVPSDTPIARVASAGATPQPPSATATARAATSTPTGVPALAYRQTPSASPTPSATTAPPTATPTVAATASPTAAAAATTATASATPAVPTPSATPLGAQDTPVQPLATAIVATPTATQPPVEVAENVQTATPPVFNAAGSLAKATPSATVTGPFFPLPAAANAGSVSPLVGTQPLSSGVALHFAGTVSAAAAPLPVLTPAPHQIALRALLLSYGFAPLAPITGSDSPTSFGAQVSLEGRRYRVSVAAQGYGYRLLLQQAGPISPTANPVAPFDAAAAATAFVHAHQLDQALGAALQEDGVSAGAGGATVRFSTRLPYRLYGGGATFIYTPAGIMQSADIRLVDDSAPITLPAISEQDALAVATGGGGLVQTVSGLPPYAVLNIRGATLIYAPVLQDRGAVFEPLYQFVGTASDGSPFAVYVPALDRAYLKP